jgi:hypothetical protein
MTVDQLIAKSQMVCAQNGRVYPGHLRQMAAQWNREGMSISSVFAELESALAQGLPVEGIDGLIRKRHAEKVAILDARTKSQCTPLPESKRYVPHQWPRQPVNYWRGPSDE